MRSSYGVALIGCSGREVIAFSRRTMANKARVAVREHIATGGHTGAQTLKAVARKAAKK